MVTKKKKHNRKKERLISINRSVEITFCELLLEIKGHNICEMINYCPQVIIRRSKYIKI